MLNEKSTQPFNILHQSNIRKSHAKIQCYLLCNASYYGKTKRHFKVRMCEYLGVSALTGKRVKGDNDSAIKEHYLFAITHLVLTIFPY